MTEAAGQREARRTALILAASQAIVGSAAPIAISIGGLAGWYLLGTDKSLATAPVTGFNVGVALGALPAAALLRRLGHKAGFQVGTVFTALGGGSAAFCLVTGLYSGCSPWRLMVIGLGGAFVQQFQLAAADNAPPEFKARAMSFVLAGGIVTAILGPQIVITTRELFAPVMFAGFLRRRLGLAAGSALFSSFLSLLNMRDRVAFAVG